MVKITDFGLARMIDDVQLTQNGVVAGTPEYMAPEQARGEAVDHRADLFSLGSVLYAMCTGAPPFRGAAALAVLRQVSEETPTPIRELNPNVPAWLEALVARLMAKAPADRFQSAAEVANLLQGYRAHLQQSATVSPPELPSCPVPLVPPDDLAETKQANPVALPTDGMRMQPRMTMRKWLLAAVGIVTVLGLLGGIGALLFRSPEPRDVVQGALPAAEPQEPEPMDGLVCLLVNKNSGRCLSVAGRENNPGAKVVQGPKPDQAGPTERWTLLGAGKAFRLRNERSRLVLEIGSANLRKGVAAIHWHDHGTRANQHWTFERRGDGWLLRAGHSKLVLGIGQGSLAEGAPALQWNEVPDVPDQVWELRSIGGSAGEAKVVQEVLYHDFRGGRLPAELTVLDDGRFVKPTPEGLRMTLPKDRADLGPARVVTSFGVGGDFEITAAFEILRAEEPSGGYGVGPVCASTRSAPRPPWRRRHGWCVNGAGTKPPRLWWGSTSMRRNPGRN